MSKKVVFYNTSATGFLQTKKNAAAIQQLLTAKKVPFTEIDCAVDAEAQQHMFSISGKKILPQVHVDDKYIGGWEEIEFINEEPAEFDRIFK